MAFLSNLAIVWFLPDTNPWLIGVSVASLAAGILIFRHIREHYQDRELVTSNKNTIALSALTGLLTTLALIIG
jgi:hypothetical protein